MKKESTVYSKGTEKSVTNPEGRLTGASESLDMVARKQTGLLQEQQVPLTAESFSQPYSLGS